MHQVVPGRARTRPPPLPLQLSRDGVRDGPPTRRGQLRKLVALLGPAFVAAVAYIDPGNFATNFSAGAKFGYALVWVVVLANLVAMLVQYESAKLGVAAGTCPRSAGSGSRARSRGGCGCRPSWSPWPPTWPSSSAPPSG